MKDLPGTVRNKLCISGTKTNKKKIIEKVSWLNEVNNNK